MLCLTLCRCVCWCCCNGDSGQLTMSNYKVLLLRDFNEIQLKDWWFCNDLIRHWLVASFAMVVVVVVTVVDVVVTVLADAEVLQPMMNEQRGVLKEIYWELHYSDSTVCWTVEDCVIYSRRIGKWTGFDVSQGMRRMHKSTDRGTVDDGGKVKSAEELTTTADRLQLRGLSVENNENWTPTENWRVNRYNCSPSTATTTTIPLFRACQTDQSTIWIDFPSIKYRSSALFCVHLTQLRSFTAAVEGPNQLPLPLCAGRKSHAHSGNAMSKIMLKSMNYYGDRLFVPIALTSKGIWFCSNEYTVVKRGCLTH